jgi:beta-catenin-like protein 1
MLENKEEVTEEEEDDWYLRRIEAGLAALQTADYVLAWVCMEDDGVSQDDLLFTLDIRGRS